MAISYSKSSGVFDLNHLIRLQQPLEVLVAERNKEDNAAVLEYVNAFLDVVDSDLGTPRKYKQYTFGEKDSFIRSKLAQRLELVASRILEKQAMKCSTLSLDELDFFEEELNFFTDLYFVLVTTLIDLASIRKQDLLPESPHDELFGIVELNLDALAEIPQMKELFAELEGRKDAYTDRPLLSSRINDLLQKLPRKSGEFIFNPTRSISDYKVGDILVSIDPESNVVGIEVGDLPVGVDLNENTGDIYVKEAADLEAGVYNVLIKTADELGGVSRLQLELPIGTIDIPRYVVAPSKVINDYLQDDLLAKPNLSDNVIGIAKAEWLPAYEGNVPSGVVIDEQTGDVKVLDEDLLEIGIYRVVVLITNIQGGKSRHEFTLAFRQDKDAVYTIKPNKLIGEFKTGDVLATVKDEDGVILRARRNQMPSGVGVNSEGEVVVEDPTKLKSGTHVFNVIAQEGTSINSVKTLFLTFDPAQNSFAYDISGLKPIDDLSNSDKIATLSNPNGITASKTALLSGEIPEGTTLMPNGDLIVSNASKLKIGNYDLRIKVFTDGIDAGLITEAENDLESKEMMLQTNQSDLSNAQDEIVAKKTELSQLEKDLNLEKTHIENGIAAIQAAMDNATGSEQEQLQQQLETKLQELDQIITTGNAQVEEIESAILELKAVVNTLNENISTLEVQITEAKIILLRLKNDRWIIHEVPLALAFEEDHDSAWHIEIPKDYDEYHNGEIIAKLIDCDGYDKVEITSGSLPLGLGLNVGLGAIEVSDRLSLTPGEYVVQTQSTDKESGVTQHRLAIIIDGEIANIDEEYIMLTPKSVSDYEEGEIIAYPYSTSHTVTSARVSRGLLPLGLELDETSGAILVSDPTELSSGYFDGIVVKTTNNTGSVNYHNVSMKFETQRTFEVVVSPGKPLSDYNKDDVIVQVNVSAGALQGVQMVGGELATGLRIDSANGKVIVEIEQNLQAGEFQLDLYMIDVDGADDTQSITYTIGPEENDPGQATISWMNKTPMYLSEATPQRELAVPTISAGQIVNSVAHSLPEGMGLESETGIIFVTTPSALTAGMHQVSVDIEDDTGHMHPEQVKLEILSDAGDTRQITWSNNTPISFDDAKTLTELASPTISEGQIVGATSGFIPSGMGLRDDSGIVYVAAQDGLIPELHQVSIQIYDEKGNVYNEEIFIEITPSTIGHTPTITWSNNTPISLGEALTGRQLAVPTISQGQIVSAFSDNIPLGLGVKAETGIIYVAAQKSLKAGLFQVSVQLQDEKGQGYKEVVPIELTFDATSATSSGPPTIVAEVTPPADFHVIKNGYILSRLNPEDIVQTATLTAGSIPEGSELDSRTGRVFVTNRINLDRSLNAGQLTVLASGDSSLTNSLSSGTLVSSAFLTSKSTSVASSQPVDFEIVNNSIPDFTQKDPIVGFIQGMVGRLEVFRQVRFQDAQVDVALKPHFDQIEAFAQITSNYIGNLKGRLSMLAGDRDSFHSNEYLVMANPLMGNLLKTMDPKIKEAYIDLYNELFTTYLAISIFRDQDISSRTDNPIAILYGNIDNHIESASGVVDTVFLRENAFVIFNGIPAIYKNLMGRFASLRS